MKNVNTVLYEAFQKNKNASMPAELYYALLNWADSNPDLRQNYLKTNDVYRVEYYIMDEFFEKTFCAEDYDNPYLAAREFISEELKNPSLNFQFQLSIDPNPCRPQNRTGKILLTNME